MERLNIKSWFTDEKQEYQNFTLFRDGKKKFQIYFGGNLDLYFQLLNFDEDATFLIGKDNYGIYEIFDTLYHDIMEGYALYDENDITRIIEEAEAYGEDYHVKLQEFKSAIKMRKQNTKNIAFRTGLIEQDMIVWRSDDFDIEIAPYFKIQKLKNAYQIIFGIPTQTRTLTSEEDFYLRRKNWISVRIRNSGSRYEMLNVPFMKAYHALKKYSEQYSQIHIEEYLIEKELEQGKSLEKILRK